MIQVCGPITYYIILAEGQEIAQLTSYDALKAAMNLLDIKEQLRLTLES